MQKTRWEIDYTNPYDENGDGRDINLHAAVFVSEKDEYARVDNPGFRNGRPGRLSGNSGY